MSATGYLLRQVIDRLDPGAGYASPLPALNRVLYCRHGGCRISDGSRLREDEAWFGRDEVTVVAGPDGAVIWRWELAASGSAPALPRGDGVVSTENLVAELDGPDPADDWLMRCDSVKFPMGGCALPHVHEGPGIRCLRDGQIRIETGDQKSDYLPGQAWFESGKETVFAQASELECTRFVRVMVLPAELRGKSSIRYVNEEDLEKPKSQRYQGYVDEPIDH